MDTIAYGNLEKIVIKGDEDAFEYFLTLWKSLLITFHVQPSDDFLYATFHLRCGLSRPLTRRIRTSWAQPAAWWIDAARSGKRRSSTSSTPVQ
eukprot:15746762-Heterocapsa_arctica.AAC.1